MKKSVLVSMFFALLFTACSEENEETKASAPELLSGTISAPLNLVDRNINSDAPDYTVKGKLLVQSDITVAPGVIISMQNGSEIYVDSTGSFYAEGTPAYGIKITGEKHENTWWKGIGFKSNTSKNVLGYTTVEDGSSTYGLVYLRTDAQVKIHHSVLRNSAGYGIYANFDNGGFLPGFSANTISDCAKAPIAIRAENMHEIDGETTAANCVNNWIEVENSGAVEGEAKSWKKTKIPFYIKGSTATVKTDITVEAGAQFLMAPGSGFDIISTGSLKAVGTETDKIVFKGEEDVQGYWGNIYFNNSNNDKNEFSYVVVSNGGGSGTSGTGDNMLYLGGATKLKLSKTHFSKSKGYAIKKSSEASLIDEGGNTFEENALGDIKEN